MNELHEKLRSIEGKYKMFDFNFDNNVLSYIGPDDYQKTYYLVNIVSDLEKLNLRFRIDDEDRLHVYC